MKFSTVIQKLSQVANQTKDARGTVIFKSRVSSHRYVKVHLTGPQGEQALALPIYQQYDGEELVAFHAKTIKSLVEFLSE